MFKELGIRSEVAEMPFCIADNKSWSTWTDSRLIWDWIGTWARFWIGFGGPNLNLNLNLNLDHFPHQILNRFSFIFDRFWNLSGVAGILFFHGCSLIFTDFH